MIASVFAVTCLCWGAVSLYFVWRFIHHRIGPNARWNWPSLVCAVAPLGWVTAVARELHWLPRWGASPLLAIAFAIGLLAVLVILNFERQVHR